MKLNVFAAGALAAALLLAGCSGSGSASSASQSASSEAAASSAAAETKVISPLPSGIDIANLDNCTVAVSFDEGDAYVDDEGKMQLKVKVYDYDLYDMVDVSTMAVGDVIVVRGEEMAITSLEQENGDYVINGGLEQGGCTLTTAGDTVYYEANWDDLKQYQELGEATIPVSDEMTLEDSSDLEKGTITWYAGDLLTDSGIEYNFVPNNTSITIQDGMVVSMTRVYNP